MNITEIKRQILKRIVWRIAIGLNLLIYSLKTILGKTSFHSLLLSLIHWSYILDIDYTKYRTSKNLVLLSDSYVARSGKIIIDLLPWRLLRKKFTGKIEKKWTTRILYELMCECIFLISTSINCILQKKYNSIHTGNYQKSTLADNAKTYSHQTLARFCFPYCAVLFR